MVKKQIFYILQCSVNNKELEFERLWGVSPSDWTEVYSLSKAQGVSGLLFDKIKSLPKEVAPPKELVMQWMSHAMSIERQTKALFEKSADLPNLWQRRVCRQWC